MASALTLVENARRNAADGPLIRRSRRSFLDFAVDGVSLAGLLDASVRGSELLADYVSVLVLDWPAGFPAKDFGQAIGDVAAPLPSGRVPLYVCPECGDLGCGAVTAVVELRVHTVVWRDFGHENDYQPFESGGVVPNVGPIVFDRRDYFEVLTAFRDRWRSELRG